MESKEESPKKKIRYKTKNVFVGRNPDTGKPYFERKKIPIITPENSVDFQPSIDELSSTDEPVFKTKEEAVKFDTEKRLKKMDEAWKNAHSKDGRPPIGGAQDD